MPHVSHVSETTPIVIRSAAVRFAGDLALPQGAGGLVIFAHGSGSSRMSPRNRFVARGLNEHGLATLLLDLLTREEEIAEQHTRQLRFDIALLAGRLETAIAWAQAQQALRGLPVGLFGASTGAAAALIAAARMPDEVRAVVSRGGRPDLAGDSLRRVRCPVMLIVGGEDSPVIELNRSAAQSLGGAVRIDIIAGATHLFEEPGALEQVTGLAQSWFAQHLLPHPAPGGPAI